MFDVRYIADPGTFVTKNVSFCVARRPKILYTVSINLSD